MGNESLHGQYTYLQLSSLRTAPHTHVNSGLFDVNDIIIYLIECIRVFKLNKQINYRATQ